MLAQVALPALAHEGNPEIRVELDAPAPALEGVEVAVVTSVTDQLVVENTSPHVLEVLDDNGDAFLQIGPDGVSANLNSEGWYQTNNPFGLSEVPERATAGAEPDWAKVAADPSWGWFDHRLHPENVVLPPEVAEAGEPARLARWTVPVRWRGEERAFTGAIVYRPLRGSVLAEMVMPPDVRGLTIAVLQGRVPGLFLENGTGETVVVQGADGEPFLRFNDKGVQANRHSPSWLAARRADAGDLSVELIDPSLPPDWERVSQVPRFGWVEPRAAYPEEEPPEDVIAARDRTTLLEWAVPMDVGGERVVATGHTLWDPAATVEEELPGWVGYVRPAATAAAVLSLLWLLVLRRRRG